MGLPRSHPSPPAETAGADQTQRFETGDLVEMCGFSRAAGLNGLQAVVVEDIQSGHHRVKFLDRDPYMLCKLQNMVRTIHLIPIPRQEQSSSLIWM